MTGRPEDHIAGWSTGNLSPEERQDLLTAALDDQALFDILVEEEPLRDLLSDPESRRALLERLAELQEGPVWWRKWLTAGTALRLAAATAAVVLAVATAWLLRLTVDDPGVRLASGPLVPPEAVALSTPRDAAELVFTPRGEPQATVNLALDREGEPPAYRLGEPLRLGFTVSVPASVALVEVRFAENEAILIYPNRWQESLLVPAEELILIPPRRQGNLEVSGRPGDRYLLLLAFPPEVDPLFGPEHPMSLPVLAVARQDYVVLPPGAE